MLDPVFIMKSQFFVLIDKYRQVEVKVIYFLLWLHKLHARCDPLLLVIPIDTRSGGRIINSQRWHRSSMFTECDLIPKLLVWLISSQFSFFVLKSELCVTFKANSITVKTIRGIVSPVSIAT